MFLFIGIKIKLGWNKTKDLNFVRVFLFIIDSIENSIKKLDGIMSIQNYLNNQESILFRWKIGPKGEIGSVTQKKVKENILGITNKRVFHFKKPKGYDRKF